MTFMVNHIVLDLITNYNPKDKKGSATVFFLDCKINTIIQY